MKDAPVDVLSEAPDEPVVQWMERPPASVPPLAIGGALVGAFLLGVAMTVAAVVVGRHLESADDHRIVLRRFR
jgi:hypothetical protein